MKRVLFITHVGDPGGAEFKMIAICRSLGEQAEVLLMQYGSLQRLLHENKIAHRVHRLAPAARAVRRESGLSGALRAIPSSLAMVRFLASHMREFDVVVCFSQKAFVLASLAKPFARTPIVWFMNDILSREHFSAGAIRMLMALSRYSADQVALVSEESLRAWISSGGRREGVNVVYSGIDEEVVARQLSDQGRVANYRKAFSPRGAPLIGMFGRICRWKGQDVFLRALAQVPAARGVIVGGNLFGEEEFERELAALITELKLEDRVSFAGHVDDPMTIMAACDVVVHCSTSPEPSGRVIAEAMFAGTPVIGSDGGGVPEFIRHEVTGQLTPLKDVPALARAIQRYLDDPAWAREIAARAHERVQRRFSARATIAGFQRALESL